MVNIKNILIELPDWIWNEGYRDKPRKWLSFLYIITRPLWVAWILYLPIKLLRDFEIEYWKIIQGIWIRWYTFSEALDIVIWRGY